MRDLPNISQCGSKKGFLRFLGILLSYRPIERKVKWKCVVIVSPFT
jgi:hypothetical protein